MRSTRATRGRSAPAAVAVLVLVTALAGCVPFGTRGDGDVKSETRQIGAFTQVAAGAGIGVTVRIGPAEPLVVEAQENLLPIISTVVEGDTLHIDSTEGFTSSEPVHVTVVVPTLEGVSLSGGSPATVEGLAVTELEVGLSGGSALTASGTAHTLDLTASGGSRADLANLVSKTVTLELAGGSVANLQASESVTGVASGGGHVTVSGAATVSVQTSGGAEVTHE
jgi:hypothetical protein